MFLRSGTVNRLDLRAVWLPATAMPRHVSVGKYRQWPRQIPRCVVTAVFSCQCVAPAMEHTLSASHSTCSPGSTSHGNSITARTIAPKSDITDCADVANGIQVYSGRHHYAWKGRFPSSSPHGGQSTATDPQHCRDISQLADILATSIDITDSDDMPFPHRARSPSPRPLRSPQEVQLLASLGYHDGTKDIAEHQRPHSRDVHVVTRIPSERSQTGSNVTTSTISQADGSFTSDTKPPYQHGTASTGECATAVGPSSPIALPYSAYTTRWDECALSDDVAKEAAEHTKSMRSNIWPSNSHWSITSGWRRTRGAIRCGQ